MTLETYSWRAIQYFFDDLFRTIYHSVSRGLLRDTPSSNLFTQRVSSLSNSQIPSNIVLRVLGARLWLTICVVGWGAAQLGMGFVPTWGYLVLCRILLGIFEVCLQSHLYRKDTYDFLFFSSGWLLSRSRVHHHYLV